MFSYCLSRLSTFLVISAQNQFGLPRILNDELESYRLPRENHTKRSTINARGANRLRGGLWAEYEDSSFFWLTRNYFESMSFFESARLYCPNYKWVKKKLKKIA